MLVMDNVQEVKNHLVHHVMPSVTSSGIRCIGLHDAAHQLCCLVVPSTVYCAVISQHRVSEMYCSNARGQVKEAVCLNTSAVQLGGASTHTCAI